MLGNLADDCVRQYTLGELRAASATWECVTQVVDDTHDKSKREILEGGSGKRWQEVLHDDGGDFFLYECGGAKSKTVPQVSDVSCLDNQHRLAARRCCAAFGSPHSLAPGRAELDWRELRSAVVRLLRTLRKIASR